MSLLFKQNFDDYSVGHNLIGVEDMDWTKKYESGGPLTFEVDSNKWNYLDCNSANWCGVAPNHPNISDMGDGTIIYHPKQIVTYGMAFLYHYSSAGGYHVLWESAALRVRKFSGWNPFNSIEIANWDGLNPSGWVYEMEIKLDGDTMSLYLNGKFINSVLDSSYTSGMIGLSAYVDGFKSGDIYVFDDNSMSPLQPTNLTLAIIDANTIKLNFDNTAFNADYICIERKNGVGGIFLEIDRAPGTAQSYIDKNCQPNNNYYYRVRAVRL